MTSNVYLLIFIQMVFSFSRLDGEEITPKFLAHCLQSFGPYKEEVERKNKLAKENLDVLEKIIFELKKKGYPGDRGIALYHFAKLSREGVITKEKFFDIFCRLLKNFDDIVKPYEKSSEIGIYKLYVGTYGYDYRTKREKLKFSDNLEAFLIFVQTMKKYDLIFDPKTFDFMKDPVEEVQKLLEAKSENWKEKIIDKLATLEKEISNLPETRMDKIARDVADFYAKGLVKQATTLKPQ